MNEQELDLPLNRTTKLVLRGYPGRSVVLEIQRLVNSQKEGHGWGVESQVFLDGPQLTELQDYVAAILPRE